MAAHPPIPALTFSGTQLMVSELITEQFRFPHSRKKRIRNKWTKRPQNWRPSRQAYQIGDTLFMHPIFAAQLASQLGEEAVEQKRVDILSQYPYYRENH